MSWTIVFEKKAHKELTKLDQTIQRKIIFELEKLSLVDDPRKLGKPLTSKFTGLWRYRIGDYRVVCQIIDNKLQILIIKIGHRKEIYKVY